MENENKTYRTIYCSYDHLNPVINRVTGEEVHACEYYGTVLCNNCECRYDGEKILRYMEANPVDHEDIK